VSAAAIYHHLDHRPRSHYSSMKATTLICWATARCEQFQFRASARRDHKPLRPPLAVAARASSPKVNWPGCCARSQSGRAQSGRLLVGPVIGAAEATCTRSLRPLGAPIVRLTTRQHNRGKSDT
jgi:hypothetical protein